MKELNLNILLGYILFAFNKKFNCQQCLDVLKQKSEDLDDPRNQLIDLREYNSHANNLVRPNPEFVEWMTAAVTFFEKQFPLICYKKNILENICNRFLSEYTTLNCGDEHSSYMVRRVYLIVLRAVLKRKNALFKTSKRRLSKFDNLNNL